MPNTTHSPLPWRPCPRRPHEVLDAAGDAVLALAWPADGGPDREIANLDLVLRSVNGFEPLLASARLALNRLEWAAAEGVVPDDVLQAVGLLRRALGEQAQAAQPA